MEIKALEWKKKSHTAFHLSWDDSISCPKYIGGKLMLGVKKSIWKWGVVGGGIDFEIVSSFIHAALLSFQSRVLY